MIVAGLVLVSGDAVQAFGPEQRPPIATGEIVTLISGYPVPEAPPPRSSFGAALGLLVMNLPAWLVLGIGGFVLCRACRPRRRRYRLRPG